MNLRKEAFKILLAVLVWLTLIVCYSPQVIQPSDTRRIQDNTEAAKKELDSVIPRVPPSDRSAIINASSALNTCVEVLREQETKLNECVKSNNDCVKNYNTQNAELKEFKAKSGIFAWIEDKIGRIGNAVFWFTMGGLFAGIVYRILIARLPV